MIKMNIPLFRNRHIALFREALNSKPIVLPVLSGIWNLISFIFANPRKNRLFPMK